MNYKIAKTMLVLCGVYLIAFYILKFIFPEMLLQVITSPTMLRLGEVISTWKGFEFIFNIIGVSITFYLFACASSGKYLYNKSEIIYITSAIFISVLIYYLLPQLYTHTSTCCLFIMSVLIKGKFSYSVISFTIHGFLSQFLLEIRGFETIITTISGSFFLSGYVLSLEMYIWLILLSIIFYFKEKKYGTSLPSVSQQKH